MLVKPGIFCRMIVYFLGLRINASYLDHIPVTLCYLVNELTIVAVTVNMVIARTVRYPEKLFRFFRKINHIIDIGIEIKNSNPGSVLLLQYYMVLTCFYIKKVKFHVVLSTVEGHQCQNIRSARPINAGDIKIACFIRRKPNFFT